MRVLRLNADLSAHADVPATAEIPLTANSGICSQGYKPHGTGFVFSNDEARALIAADSRHAEIIKPYQNGLDLVMRPRGFWIVDFAYLDEDGAKRYPMLYDLIRDRVRPEREANARAVYRTYWWRFGEARREFRAAIRGLPRYIATVKTAKHRFFTFLEAQVAPDDNLTCVASSDAFLLGVLSSSVHATWALAAGSRLGIDGTPRYNKGGCFEAFPFPTPIPELRTKIAELAERIDSHRKAALARGSKIGMTTMYNVVDRLRSGEALTKAEREVHELAACGTLRDLHDELDRTVAEAYGWTWPEPPAVILDRLVTLHDVRGEEERAGTVRWLRPDYQIARFGKQTEADIKGPGVEDDAAVAVAAPIARVPWPGDAIGQITALRALTATRPTTVDEAASHFAGARRDLVVRHLETLAILGEVNRVGDSYSAAPPPAT